MRVKSLALLLATALLLCQSAVLAGDEPKKEEAPVAQTAVFTVPNLSDEAVVKDLTKALAKTEGILAAKAEPDAGRFLVTFESAKTCADTLAVVVAKVAPDAKLQSVEASDAKPAGHDCGKCPSRSSCGKAKKTS